MALLLLIIIGMAAGWFASILARTEEAGAIVRQMGVGLAASLVVGLIINSGTILGGLSMIALGSAVAAAIAALVAYHMITGRSADA